MKFDPSNEPVDMDVEVPTLVHLDGIAIGQWGKTRRQVSLAGHARSVDPDRNDGDVPLERSLDLDPDVIARVCQPVRAPALPSHFGPITTRSTSHRETSSLMNCRKSTPNGMASMSKTTAPLPK